jgi:hypothetical protein
MMRASLRRLGSFQVHKRLLEPKTSTGLTSLVSKVKRLGQKRLTLLITLITLAASCHLLLCLFYEYATKKSSLYMAYEYSDNCTMYICMLPHLEYIEHAVYMYTSSTGIQEEKVILDF